MKTSLLLLLLTTLIQTVSYDQPKTYILIHGAWHGAWCWKKVTPLLEAKGDRVLAIDLPGHGNDKTPAASVALNDYVQKVVGVANAQTGPVILVGHSMAGVVIAQAAEVLGKEKVSKVVFLDAFMPQNDVMIYREVLPCLALQPFVRNYLLVNLDSYFFPVKPYPTRIEQALVFFARGHIECYDPLTDKSAKIASNALFGQQVSRLNFHTFTGPDFLMVMVIFQPGAMYRLLGFSSNELTREFCDAESVISSELRSVNDQIANAVDYAEIIERTEVYLLRKLKNLQIDAHPIDRIGALLLHNPTPFSLDWLADQANLSPRQFERKFNERIGIGPKLYSRISRFYQTFAYKEQHPDIDWLTVAVQFGYTDYDHLAKDFKQFTNVTPNIILKEYAQRPEIVVNL